MFPRVVKHDYSAIFFVSVDKLLFRWFLLVALFVASAAFQSVSWAFPPKQDRDALHFVGLSLIEQDHKPLTNVIFDARGRHLPPYCVPGTLASLKYSHKNSDMQNPLRVKANSVSVLVLGFAKIPRFTAVRVKHAHFSVTTTYFQDLLRRMLKLDPNERASIPEIFNHSWLRFRNVTSLDNQVDEQKIVYCPFEKACSL